MHSSSRLATWVRRRLGRAVHDAGGATRSDIRSLQSELEQLRGELSACLGVAVRVDGMQARLDDLSARVDWLHRADGEARATLAWVKNMLAIDAFSRFIGCVSLRTEPLVSVVLPTYNRPEPLARAIDSVIAQRYRNWELLVVDDGGEADSESVVEMARNSRIRWARAEHGGVCAARNAALAMASGEIIAYLDDDNVMDPEWLYSVVWAFAHRPEIDVLYGAVIVDDFLRVNGESSGHLPRAFLHPWNRDALRESNLADIGAIAHRRALPEARFDESLQQMGDWDLLLRLTADADPLVLPAIACYYMTDAPDRLTLGPTQAADGAAVRARAALLSEGRS